MKKVAFRTIRLCTKDCLCLFVCPTGATDTENSIIDMAKCISCGACAESCPSKAISMIPLEYPEPARKAEAVVDAMNNLAEAKMAEEAAARKIAATTDADGAYRLMTAAARSIRLTAADVMREAGYLLPQSNSVRELLKDLIEQPPTPDFPVAKAQKLLDSL
ncbi:MAG: 4Fe-4S binding protein [Lachnospiraceae bacterium]|nr:4Fe-4S binding protein [Lachnospiraceae bacterium]